MGSLAHCGSHTFHSLETERLRNSPGSFPLPTSAGPAESPPGMQVVMEEVSTQRLTWTSSVTAAVGRTDVPPAFPRPCQESLEGASLPPCQVAKSPSRQIMASGGVSRTARLCVRSGEFPDVLRGLVSRTQVYSLQPGRTGLPHSPSLGSDQGRRADHWLGLH